MNLKENMSFFETAESYEVDAFSIKEKEIKKGLHVSYMNMTSHECDKKTHAEGESDFKGISVSFNMNGRFSFENEVIKINSWENSTNILYTSRGHGQVSFDTFTYDSVAIMIEDSFLGENFLSQLKIDPDKDKLLKNEPTNPETLICLKDMINCPYENVLESLYTESKILEIIANEFSPLFQTEKKSACKSGLILTKMDIKALNKAKDILICEIENPPSIKELSRMVALNEFKLKVGFKKLFKTTPYSIVRDHRMKVAKELLESSEYNVSEVSKRVGIKNPAHFTRSFFKYYKRLPKDVMKTRGYYFIN